MRQEIIVSALGKDAAEGVDPGPLATSTVRAVRLLLAELRPLVGELATTALYGRSLHLARASFQQQILSKSVTHNELLALLQQDLASRSRPDAQRAARALLNSLVDLLISLIGEPLTNQILNKAWGVQPDASSSEEIPL
jgi:hypothetical protein